MLSYVLEKTSNVLVTYTLSQIKPTRCVYLLDYQNLH